MRPSERIKASYQKVLYYNDKMRLRISSIRNETLLLVNNYYT